MAGFNPQYNNHNSADAEDGDGGGGGGDVDENTSGTNDDGAFGGGPMTWRPTGDW